MAEKFWNIKMFFCLICFSFVSHSLILSEYFPAIFMMSFFIWPPLSSYCINARSRNLAKKCCVTFTLYFTNDLRGNIMYWERETDTQRQQNGVCLFVMPTDRFPAEDALVSNQLIWLKVWTHWRAHYQQTLKKKTITMNKIVSV